MIFWRSKPEIRRWRPLDRFRYSRVRYDRRFKSFETQNRRGPFLAGRGGWPRLFPQELAFGGRGHRLG